MTSIYKASDDSMHPKLIPLGNSPIIDAALHIDDEPLKPIPCSRPHSWEDGKEYVEGKDYEVCYPSANGYLGYKIMASPLPSNEDELWEEAWDESTYIEDDIDSLQQVAGSCVITKRDFDKLKYKFHITRK